MDVSVIIVNYNTFKMTSECIDSVIENTKGLTYEIILVDNASSDGSKEFFENDIRIKYIYLNENIGFGRANNIGIQHSTGDYIFLLNSDTILINNSVLILYTFLSNHNEFSIVGGLLRTIDGEPTHSYSLFLPSIIWELDLLLGNIISKLYLNIMAFKCSNYYKKVGYVTGADMMIRRKDLEDIGCFNPQFFMYFEETELAYRFKKHNKNIAFHPESQIYHLQGQSFKVADFQEKTFVKSRTIYYNIIYPKWKKYLANSIYSFTCISRIVIYKIINNQIKANYWIEKFRYFNLYK